MYKLPKWQEKFSNGPNPLQASTAARLDVNKMDFKLDKWFNRVLYMEFRDEWRFCVLYKTTEKNFRVLYPNLWDTDEFASTRLAIAQCDMRVVAPGHTQKVLASS